MKGCWCKVLNRLQYLYSFNHGKFSIQAPFVLNERQKKSAGSFLAGAQFSQYTMDADSSVIPANIGNDYYSDFQLFDINVSTLGANFGYMYTFVFKSKIFFTLGFIPSINFNFGDYQTQYREPLEKNLSFGYTTMNAFGYNSRRFFTGFQFSLTTNPVKFGPEQKVTIRHGNAKYFVGWRLKNKK